MDRAEGECHSGEASDCEWEFLGEGVEPGSQPLDCSQSQESGWSIFCCFGALFLIGVPLCLIGLWTRLVGEPKKEVREDSDPESAN